VPTRSIELNELTSPFCRFLGHYAGRRAT
jgi:hypothetical protein